MFEEWEDQISTLNKLSTVCLETHAPTVRVKLTHPIPPWMKDPTIISDRKKLELCQIKSCDSKNPKEHQKYLEGKKQYKKTIKDKRNLFFHKALSSKNPKSVSNSIDRTLNKQQQQKINHEPSEMNNYFSKLAANLSSKENNESNLS